MSRKIIGMRLGHSRVRAGALVLATATMALCTAAGVAFGQAGAGTETTTTTEGTATDATAPTADPTTTTGDTQSTATTTDATGEATSSDETATASGTEGGSKTGGGGGSLRLIAEAANPGKAFIYGDHRVSYSYTLDGDRSKDLKIQAVKRRNWKTVKVWRKDNVKPGTYRVRWNGITRDGKPASKGAYLFRIRTIRRDRELDRSRAKGDDRSVKLYPAKFPVRGRHTYGDGFGAARSGHSHQGQDVFAKCGTPLVAARGGRVQYSGYQGGGAGYYVVIDGRRDKKDYVYMHLKRRGPRKGSRVRTGERIARVGQSGNASGCHLHFEVWSKPGWYEGGHAMRSVTKKLKQWDHWS